MKYENYFGKTEISEEKELGYKTRYDITMDPREWQKTVIE